METVDAAPKELTREEFVAWFAAIGIDAKDCRSIEVRPDRITAEMYDLNEEGNPQLCETCDQVMTHTIHIRVGA